MPARLAAALLYTSLLAIRATPGLEPYIIRNDHGGIPELYRTRFVELAVSERPVIVDGVCNSACTLVLAYIPKERLCVTERAAMMFHAAAFYDGDRRTGTNWYETWLMFNEYPYAIQAWIISKGGLLQRPLILYGRELREIVRPCDE